MIRGFTSAKLTQAVGIFGLSMKEIDDIDQKW
jgi:hypothetical protein